MEPKVEEEVKPCARMVGIPVWFPVNVVKSMEGKEGRLLKLDNAHIEMGFRGECAPFM